MNWLERNTPARLRFVSECRGFVIVADKPSEVHMPWWQAKTAGGNDVASGYGDAGLAKCRRYCELAANRPVVIEPTPVEPTRVEIHAPIAKNEPAHFPTTSAQSALF